MGEKWEGSGMEVGEKWEVSGLGKWEGSGREVGGKWEGSGRMQAMIEVKSTI